MGRDADRYFAEWAPIAARHGFILVVPEYNHSFPGLLKHVLDSCLSEYIHKAVGLVGVSAGPFAGTRVVQGLLPVMREIGRWYDLDIVYEGEPEPEEMMGELQRNLTLSQVMKILQKLHVKYRVEGRKLIVMKT